MTKYYEPVANNTNRIITSLWYHGKRRDRLTDALLYCGRSIIGLLPVPNLVARSENGTLALTIPQPHRSS